MFTGQYAVLRDCVSYDSKDCWEPTHLTATANRPSSVTSSLEIGVLPMGTLPCFEEGVVSTETNLPAGKACAVSADKSTTVGERSMMSDAPKVFEEWSVWVTWLRL